MINQDAYAAVAREAIDRFLATQREAVAEAARLASAALMAGGVLQAFGTGHSRAVALELVGRAGGLVPANQLAIRDLVYYGDTAPAQILDPLVERVPDLADRIWDLAAIEPADVFVIASNSGGNGAIVEMAQLARRRGHPLIAITSREHSAAITSRHPSGMRLAELADVVIDNCAPFGDAAVALPDGGSIGPLSNLTGILAANLLVVEIAGHY
ncbi:MAG TPA: sugar isomerase domain-containing protein, partial [Trebonia sp.]